MTKIKNLIKNNLLTITLLTIFFLVRLPYFMSNAFVFDELWFSERMRGLHVDNYLSYGAAFWVFGWVIALLTKIVNFKYAMFALRLTSLISLCVAGYYIDQLAKSYKSPYRFFILLVYLSLPMVWFGGKLIAPEFYLLAILTWSSYKLLQPCNDLNLLKGKQEKWPWIMLGFAVSLKISAVLAVFTIVLLRILYIEKISFFSCRNLINSCWNPINSSRLLRYILLMIAGFIICNPQMLWEPHAFIREFSPISVSSSQNFVTLNNTLGDIQNIIFKENVTWDLVLTQNLNQNVCSLASFILITLLIILNTNFIIIIIYCISLLLLAEMIHLDNPFYIWHIFPSVVILPIILSLMRIDGRAIVQYFNTVCLALIVVFNSLETVKMVKNDLASRKMFVSNLADKEYYKQCLIDTLQGLKPTNIIIDLAEYGRDMNRKNLIDYDQLSENIPWVQQWLASNNLIITDNLLDASQLLKAHPVLGIDNNKTYVTIITVTNLRYKTVANGQSNPIDNLQKQLKNEFGLEKTSYVVLARCKNMEIGKILVSHY
jgi:hypothetical protein